MILLDSRTADRKQNPMHRHFTSDNPKPSANQMVLKVKPVAKLEDLVETTQTQVCLSKVSGQYRSIKESQSIARRILGAGPFHWLEFRVF